MAVTSSAFVAAMGQHVSSVCVITTQHEGQRYGLTATAMSSVSAEPPKLLVCVNRSGVSHAQILASGIFCVNVLSDSQDMVARSFAGMLGSRDDRFAVGRWSSLQSGAPVLLDAVCSFDCKLSGVVEQHSHSIIIGDVIAVASRQGAEPLLYGGRRFLTLGETSTSLPGSEGKKSPKSG